MARRRGMGLGTILLIGALVVGGFFLLGGQTFQIDAPGAASPAETGALDFSGVCDSNNQKSVGWSLTNSLNASGTEDAAATVRVYKVVNGEEVFFNTATSAVSPTAISLDCGTKYVGYVEATSTRNSIRFDAADLSTPNAVTKQPRIVENSYAIDWAGLLFRVFDNDNNAFTFYTDDALTQGEYVGTGKTAESTTNTTAFAVGEGGALNLRVDFKTNATSASDTEFVDKGLVISADMTRTDFDVNSAVIQVAGATATKRDCGAIDVVFANDDEEVCWEITSGGSPLAVNKGTVHSATFTVTALSGVDPSTDITLAWTSSGYYKENVGSGMKQGYSKDDSTRTKVHTQQTIAFDIS